MRETVTSTPPVNWDALPLMLTVQEAAGVLRVDAHTVYELVRTHRLPHVHVGRRPIRIPRDQLREHLEQPHPVQEPGYVPPTLHRTSKQDMRVAAFNRRSG